MGGLPDRNGEGSGRSPGGAARIADCPPAGSLPSSTIFPAPQFRSPWSTHTEPAGTPRAGSQVCVP